MADRLVVGPVLAAGPAVVATVFIAVAAGSLAGPTAGTVVVGIVSCVEIVPFPGDVQAIVPSIAAASSVIVRRRRSLLIHPFSPLDRSAGPGGRVLRRSTGLLRIGTRDPPSLGDDGGVTINLFSTPPADGTFPVASGLPIPDGPFAMSFGAYWPSERIAPEEIRWTLPPDEPVGAFASSEAM